jgi:hypothetical protein
VGPVRRVDDTNPEGYIGPYLGNPARKRYRGGGRLGMMEDLKQAARGGRDLHVGLTAGGNHRPAAKADLHGGSGLSDLSRGGAFPTDARRNGDGTALIEVDPSLLGVYTSNMKINEVTPQDAGGTQAGDDVETYSREEVADLDIQDNYPADGHPLPARVINSGKWLVGDEEIFPAFR